MNPIDDAGRFHTLGDLDAELRRRLERLKAAEAAGDAAAAARQAAEAESLFAVDMAGHLWRGVVKRPGVYQRSTDGGGSWRYYSSAKFADVPRLGYVYTREVADRSRVVAFMVRNIEPIGYTAAAAIGIGLWALLGDLLGSLPHWVIIAFLVASAAGLWIGSYVLAGYRYLEVHRLSTVMYVASVAVAWWTVWVASDRIISAEGAAVTAARLAASFGTALLLSLARYLWRGDSSSYVLTVTTAIPTGWAAGAAFDSQLSTFVGILVALAGVYLLAGRTTVGPRRLWGYLGASLVTWYTLLLAVSLDEPQRLVAVVIGLAVAAVAYEPVRDQGRDLRMMAMGDVAAATVLAVTLIPWAFLREVFDDVPLPVLLVVGGSAALIVLAVVVRRAIRTVGDDAGRDRDRAAH